MTMNASRQPTAFILRGPTFATVLANLTSFLARLPTDKAWEVTVKPHRKARTDAQNRALFGVAYPALMAFMGLSGERDRDDLHRDCCCLYFGTVTTPLGGTKPRRTTTHDETGAKNRLPWDEFSEFYAFVQRKGAEIGCYVPDPDPMWALNDREAA